MTAPPPACTCRLAYNKFGALIHLNAQCPTHFPHRTEQENTP